MTVHLDDAPMRVLDALDRLCRKGSLLVVNSTGGGGGRTIQTNSAERWGVAYTYRTSTRGRTRILAPTSDGRVEWGKQRTFGRLRDKRDSMPSKET